MAFFWTGSCAEVPELDTSGVSSEQSGGPESPPLTFLSHFFLDTAKDMVDFWAASAHFQLMSSLSATSTPSPSHKGFQLFLCWKIGFCRIKRGESYRHTNMSSMWNRYLTFALLLCPQTGCICTRFSVWLMWTHQELPCAHHTSTYLLWIGRKQGPYYTVCIDLGTTPYDYLIFGLWLWSILLYLHLCHWFSV